MDQVDEVKSKVDLVDVISSYIPLKKMGRNMGGLCPFHGEKTPSFMVSPDRQVWKCFGCGEGGDVFTFVEKIEGWDFREALEDLAKKAGVKLKSFGRTDSGKFKDKLLEINKLVTKFYAYILNKHKAGEAARNYLTGRGVDRRLWEKFDLGFAPEGWENVLGFLTKRGFEVGDIATAGMVIGREGRAAGKGGYYDRFRNRLMFPIKDRQGVVMGFAGRVLDPKVKEAKYVNSPETPIFNKGSLLFGLDLAKAAIRQKGEIILVEGEFDVISAHKAGTENVVASKGTALTDKQVAIMARLTENVAVAYDSDLAGDAAARRGIELLDMAGVNVKVVTMGGKFKDPDEFAQKDAKGFKKAITRAVSVYDYFIDSATSRHDPASADGKKKIGQEILPILAKISDDLVRAHYENKLAGILGFEPSVISEAVAKRMNALPQMKQAADAGVSLEQKVDREKYFLALFLWGDEVTFSESWNLESGDFADNTSGELWKQISDIIGVSLGKKKASMLSNAKILDQLPTEFAQFIDNLYLIDISSVFSDREEKAVELSKVAARIKIASLKRKLEDISGKIREAQESSDAKKVEALAQKFGDIMKEIEQVTIDS